MKAVFTFLAVALIVCGCQAASPSWSAFDTNSMVVIQDTNLPSGFIGVKAGGSQTPWVSNINGNMFDLLNANDIFAQEFNGSLFVGDGASLTLLNASQLATGTVPIPQLPVATASSLGVVQIGSGISVTAGVISVTGGSGGTGFPLTSNVSGAGFSITYTALTNEPVVIATNISSAVGGQFNGNGIGITNVSSQTLNWNGGTNSTGVISNGTQTAVNTLYVGSLTTNNGPIIALANITNSPLAANAALVSDPNKAIASSTTTATELGYVHGVTSGIQAQINALSGGGGSGFPLTSNVSGANWAFTNVNLTNEPIVIATNLTVQGIATFNGSNYLIGTNTFISQPSSSGGALVLGLDANNRVNTNSIMTNAYTPSGGFFTPLSATAVATTNNAAGLTNMASQALNWNGGTNLTGSISNAGPTLLSGLYNNGNDTNNGTLTQLGPGTNYLQAGSNYFTGNIYASNLVNWVGSSLVFAQWVGVDATGTNVGFAQTVPSTNLTYGLSVPTFVQGTQYLNASNAPIYVSCGVVLVSAAATAGYSSMDLCIVGSITNYLAIQTGATTLTDTYTNLLSGVVPGGATYYFTNLSSGTGNSATLQPKGQIVVF